MAANNGVDPATWLAEQIEHGDPDLLRSMVKTMAETLMSAMADGVCGAEYGMRSEERTTGATATAAASGTPEQHRDGEPSPVEKPDPAIEPGLRRNGVRRTDHMRRCSSNPPEQAGQLRLSSQAVSFDLLSAQVRFSSGGQVD